MFDLPTLGAIPNPASFSAAFAADTQFAVAAWLGVAVAIYTVLLAVSLRRSKRERVQIAHEAVQLREAA